VNTPGRNYEQNKHRSPRAPWWGETQRRAAPCPAGNGPVGSSAYTHGNLATGLQGGWKQRWRSTLFSPPLVQSPELPGGFAAAQTNFGRVLVLSPLLPRYMQHPRCPPTYHTCLRKLLRLGWICKGVCKAISFIFFYFLNSTEQATRKWPYAFQARIQRRITADLVWSAVISFHTLAQDFFCWLFFCFFFPSDLALYCKYTQYSKIYTASVSIAMMPVTVLSR